MLIVIGPRRSSRNRRGMMRDVPLMATGIMGRPLLTAARKAPFLKVSSWCAERVPSGKRTSDVPVANASSMARRQVTFDWSERRSTVSPRSSHAPENCTR